MKTTTFITGTLALALSFSACQNNTSNSETDNSSMDMSDSSHMNMENTANNPSMMGAMDKMMKDMHQMQMTGNVDVDFAMMMVSHHQGAVDMAQVEIESGKDDALKQMAQKIIDEQKSEINELQTFLDSHKNPEKNYDPSKKDEGFANVMDQNMTMMMDMPKVDQDSSTDMQFVKMMVPHHQSAIQMAEGFIQFGKDPGLISMSKKMISDQNKEIEEFKKWLNSHK